MAEETLVKDALTDRMVTAGQAFADALERNGWPFVAAFWLYDWERNQWRYVLASPDADTRFREALREIFAILDATEPPLSEDALHFVAPRDRYVQELLEIAGDGYMPRDRRIRGPLIEDSYVYKVHSPEATTAATP